MANFCRGVTITDSRIKIPQAKYLQITTMKKIVLLSQEHRKTMLYILKRTWFSGAGGGFEPTKLHKLKFFKEQKEMFYLCRI